MYVYANSLAEVHALTKAKEQNMDSNYWNGIHRLLTVKDGLRMMSTDGSIWLDWTIPATGDTKKFDVLVRNRVINAVVTHLKGREGFHMDLNDGVLMLQEGNLEYPVNIEVPTLYPEPLLGELVEEWTTPTEPLAEAFRWIVKFVDSDNSDPNKCVATVDVTGWLRAGNASYIAFVSGLDVHERLSFRSQTLKAVASVLPKLGSEVKIQVYPDHVRFLDQGEICSLTVAREVGAYNRHLHELTGDPQDVTIVPKAQLLQLVQAFLGGSTSDVDWLKFTLTSTEADGSCTMKVETYFDKSPEAEDTLVISRMIQEIPGESESEFKSRVIQPASFIISGEALQTVLKTFKDKEEEIYFQFAGTCLLISEKHPLSDEQERQKIVLMTVRKG